MPEFSPELRKAFVLGKPGGCGGQWYLGINRRKAVVWPTTAKVVRWEPGRAVAWKTRESGASWIYELEADAGRHDGDRPTGAAEVHRSATSLLGPFIGGAAGPRRRARRGHPRDPGAAQGAVEA